MAPMDKSPVWTNRISQFIINIIIIIIDSSLFRCAPLKLKFKVYRFTYISSLCTDRRFMNEQIVLLLLIL